jgi:hypothetical protein
MSWRSVPLPSPAMAVALCALFVALGGASYALTVPRDSVGPKQAGRCGPRRWQTGR